MNRLERGSPWWRGRPLAVVTLLLGLVAAGTTLAMWPRNDVPGDPDAIVVLGGAGVERAQLGIELSERYDVPLVLSSSAVDYGGVLGLRCDVDAICFRPYPRTTSGEAASVAALAESMGWNDVTVATTRFHTTRARVLFRQCFGARVTVVGAHAYARRGLITYARETVGTLAAITVRRAC